MQNAFCQKIFRPQNMQILSPSKFDEMRFLLFTAGQHERVQDLPLRYARERAFLASQGLRVHPRLQRGGDRQTSTSCAEISAGQTCLQGKDGSPIRNDDHQYFRVIFAHLHRQ